MFNKNNIFHRLIDRFDRKDHNFGDILPNDTHITKVVIIVIASEIDCIKENPSTDFHDVTKTINDTDDKSNCCHFLKPNDITI
ncbi:hypothetical protein DERP_014127 [Dermatophagoides pteronyssinus]|uniref:Uncharacterized protein n=1 Tax=Dermatophagoides pteronyssinus TaxID=6956 RepID=A0ABQ8IXC8_DERPT|nr:hypothetical protein DERP_014127 [Dermatophagoides pteronyssinus]